MTELPPIKFAKPAFDIGLFTNNPDAMVEFWLSQDAFTFDHVLRISRSLTQHRLSFGHGVLKINATVDNVDKAHYSAFGSILIASPAMHSERQITDPDGNMITFVPSAELGIDHWGVEIRSSSLDLFRSFYVDLLGLSPSEDNDHIVHCGDSALVFKQDKTVTPISAPDALEGLGLRYITVQVFNVDDVYERIVSHGGKGVRAPMTLGKTARIAFVADPFGNWIELSQRASLVGSLE